jgi:hypothetical protein
LSVVKKSILHHHKEIIMFSYKIKNKNNMPIGVVLTAVFCFLSCSISNPFHSDDQDNEATSSFQYQLSAEDVTQFSIHGVNGEIHITGAADADSVNVSGERLVRSDSYADAETHLEYLTVDVQKKDSAIIVHTRQPNRSEGRTYQVDYQIRLPERMRVVVEGTNGEVTVENISNRVTIQTTNGNISCRELQGDCGVALVNGQITCDVALPARGYCELATVNGGVSLTLPPSTSAQLQAKVTNGSVSITDFQVKNLKSSRTSVSGELGSGEGSIELSTVNGNIQVRSK